MPRRSPRQKPLPWHLWLLRFLLRLVLLNWRWSIAVGVLAVLLAGALRQELPLPNPLSGATPGKTEPTSADSCIALRPAIVTLYAGTEFGSGSIISADGLIITSHHVIKPAIGDVVRIRTWAGKFFEGKVVASDLGKDLALVKFEPGQPLTPLVELAESDQPAGQAICAIGSPFNRPGVVSRGVLQGYRENGDLKAQILLHPGNSGGPMLNAQGKMIGVNKSIWQLDSGKNSGISFATNLADTKRFIAQYRPTALGAGSTDRPIAAQPKPLPPEPLVEAPVSNFDSRLGAVVDRTTLTIQVIEPGSPAEQAGLTAGDRLLKLDGQPLANLEMLQAQLKRRPAKIRLTIERNQQPIEVAIELQSR